MTLCRGVHSEVSQAPTIIVRNTHFVTTGAVMMLPAILSCTGFALERETKTRSRFVVLVDPTLLRSLANGPSAEPYFCCCFFLPHLCRDLLSLCSRMKQKNLEEPADPENSFQNLWLRVETGIWPFTTEPPVSSVAQSL